MSYGEIFLMVLSFVFSIFAFLTMGEEMKARHAMSTMFWLLIACLLLASGLDLAGV